LAFFTGAAFFLAGASADAAAFGFVGFAAVAFLGAVAFFAGAALGAAFSLSVVDA
jgi:hypothetical protein